VLIIAVSYDFESLNRRIIGLENASHAVIPASSLDSCLNAIATGAYHALIIGATVPLADRLQIAQESRALRPQASIVSVEWPGSDRLELADVAVPAAQEELLLEALRQIQYGRQGSVG
jgi:DNA-binding response OmpR family regulator